MDLIEQSDIKPFPGKQASVYWIGKYLVLYFAFPNDGGYTELDLSRFSNNGEIPAYLNLPRIPEGVFINEDDIRIDVEHHESLNNDQFTVITKAKIQTHSISPHWSALFMKTDSTAWDDGYGVYFEIATKELSFFVNHYTNAVTIDWTSNLDKWVDLAFTYDGATLRFYLNGAVIGSKAYSGVFNHSTHRIEIGRANNDNFTMRCEIENFSIYNVALPTTVIKMIHANNYGMLFA